MSEAAAQERPNFAWIGGRQALDFTNTTAWSATEAREERFLAYLDVLDWGRGANLITPDRHQRLRRAALGNPEAAYRALERARLVRELLHRLFIAVAAGAAPDPTLVAAFNDRLARSLVELRLSSGADALSWTERDEDLDAVLHPVIWSAAQILSSSDRGRLRRCANEPCGWLFIDESRNHMRKWCEMSECGNRAKARRYYARHRNRSPQAS